ncbi:MAG: amino acid permease [Crocosphaera sp.]|nr:amino acid permease [Crocosphaera sp.]
MDVQAQQSRKLPLITAICLVIANMIGTGVFTSLGFQTVDIQSGFALLCLWFIGGIFALCGALCYGELGATMPRSGGEYHYLSEIYHPVIGFLSGWISVTVGFAAPIALAAMALGAYLSSVFPIFNPLLVAVAVVIFVSFIHLQNMALGNSFQQVSTLIKVLLIALLIVCGFLLANPQDISFAPSSEDIPLIFSSPFAVSFVYVTYSYSGWNASVYLASDLKEPEKNVPRSLFIGTLVVMGFYLLLNFIFLYTTPIEQLAGELEVGYIAANQIFGSSGGKLMASLISIGLISSISSMVLAGPRVTEAIGEDIPFFRKLSHKNANGVPHYAILIQLSIVLIFLITSTFEAVTTYLGFTLTLSSFLTVLGLFIHRYKYPNAHRPYRTWGYPITPLIFLGLSVWILVFIFNSKPVESLMGLTTIAFGMPFYWFASQKKLI